MKHLHACPFAVILMLASATACGAPAGPATPARSDAPAAQLTQSPAAETASAASLPFKLEVVEVAQSTLPPVHSFSRATADGKWLIIGGRIAGLHGFGDSGSDNFPRSSANIMAYVIDPAANRVLGSVNVTQTLPPQLAGPLTATNPQSIQVGTDLYIVGGYGQDLQGKSLTTFGSLIKVNVPGLIQAITKKAPIAAYVTQNPKPDDRLRVTGGGLTYSNGIFYLVFGQDFSGSYSVENRDYNRAGGQFQKYTEKVRVFTLNPDLSINMFNQIDGGYDPNLPYHRRDLNVVDVIQPDGTSPGTVAYGGVFMAGQVAGHTVPIDVNFSTSVTTVTAAVRSGFNQGLNHYDAAHVTVFDHASRSSYTTLMGGISQFHYDAATRTLVRDQVDLSKGIDGLPFINTISTIQRGPDAAFSQYIQPAAMPGLLGTDAEFIADAGVQSRGQLLGNEVINLSKLSGRTLVGYVYGGIESAGPYSGLVTTQPATWASGRLFQIFVTPGATPVLPMPALPPVETPYVPTP